MERQTVVHPFEPVFDQNSKILILGSLPSVKSRENAFYYGNPNNRFWQVIAAVTNQPLPHSVEEKRMLLLSQGIALWDVIGQCEISGSADASIHHPIFNDIAGLVAKTRIRTIFMNGHKAYELYTKSSLNDGIMNTVVSLPSTSPANAGQSLAQLIEKWRIIGGFL